MKLKYYTKDDKKIYTLKEQTNNETKEAHYKFLKLKAVDEKDLKY